MYTFDRTLPPLLANGLDVLSIPEGNLLQVIGEARWNEIWNSDEVGRTTGWIQVESSKYARRRLEWVRSASITHYVEDVTRKVTQKTGYNVSRRHAVESMISAKIGTGQTSPTSAEVSASLKITDEISQHWSEETVTESTQVFKAGHSYISWSLVDVIEAESTEIVYFAGPGGRKAMKSPQIKREEVRCILTVYHDKVADPKAVLLSSSSGSPVFQQSLKEFIGTNTI